MCVHIQVSLKFLGLLSLSNPYTWVYMCIYIVYVHVCMYVNNEWTIILQVWLSTCICSPWWYFNHGYIHYTLQGYNRLLCLARSLLRSNWHVCSRLPSWVLLPSFSLFPSLCFQLSVVVFSVSLTKCMALCGVSLSFVRGAIKSRFHFSPKYNYVNDIRISGNHCTC